MNQQKIVLNRNETNITNINKKLQDKQIQIEFKLLEQGKIASTNKFSSWQINQRLILKVGLLLATQLKEKKEWPIAGQASSTLK